MSPAGIQKLGMPKWGLSMSEGKVIAWLAEEGAELAVGDEVVEVESEKINGAVEAPAAGVLRRRVAEEGEVVPVGGMLGVIADASVSDADVDAFVAEFQASFVPGEAEEEAGPAPETVEVGGRTLRFLRTGEGGDPVVLLHGFGGDLNNWLFSVEPLAAGRTVYSLDLPGHGESGKDVGNGSLEVLVDALRGFLEAQGIESAHLVGHSMGGLVAAALALEEPDRVRSLVLVDAAGLGPDIDREYVEGFIAASSRRELKPVLQRLFADPGLVTRQMVDDVLKYKRLDGVQDALRAIADGLFPEGRQARDLAGEIAGGSRPVLVIWGDRDEVIPPGHARALPGAEVRMIEGAGHSPHMEAAGEFNRIVEGFLSGVRAG